MQMTINQKMVLKAVALVAAAYGTCVNAQTVDSGSLLRQTESLPKQLPLQSTPLREVAPAPLEQLDEATVTVSAFAFSGNQRLAQDKLAVVVAPFLNKSLTFAQLKNAADAVTAAYREAGWVVRTYLPKQDISNGVVTLQVVEAVFGKVSIDAPEPQRIKPEIFTAIAQAAQGVDQPLIAGALDRALLLMEDLPGVTVVGRLVEGDQHGQTNLVISATDKALITGTASTDNYGSLSTGTERLNASVAINSPAGLGDLLTSDFLKTSGIDYERMAYSLPAGPSGARAGLHLSRLEYRLVGDFAKMNAFGAVQTKGLDFSYPLLRSQNKNLNLVLAYDTKNFDDTASAVLTSKSIEVLNFAVNAMQLDSFAGGGMNNATFSIVTGKVYLWDEVNSQTDATTAQTAGRYAKSTLSLSRLQTVANDMTLNVTSNMQVASRNLDSSEKLYLGGAGGIKAYPTGEGGGSEGRTLSVELQKRLDAQWTLAGFYEYGLIKVMRNNFLAKNPNQYELQGLGASMSWQASRAVVAKATVAHRLGDNVTPLDTDGSKKMTRLWINASLAF